MSKKQNHDIVLIINKSNKHMEFICVNKKDETILFTVSTKEEGKTLYEIVDICHKYLSERNIIKFSIYTKYRYHGVIKEAIDALINKNK